MREEESNWFSKWEEELPSPEELMPLSQTLITPDLAIAFDIYSPNSNSQQLLQTSHLTPPLPPSSSQLNNSSEFIDSADLGGGGSAGDEPARTLKRPRLVWTPQLHKRFVDAVAHLGIKNAVPKTIMQLMSVDGLTRENVASHLQKYRLYLKRMQGISSGGGSGGGLAVGGGDPATDHLFASSPVPAHFLHPGSLPSSEHFLPTFVPYHHNHHPQMGGHPQQQPQQYRQIGHFGAQPNGQQQFEHPFLTRPVLHRIGGASVQHNPVAPSYVEDMESGTASNGRKVLTLFPTGED